MKISEFNKINLKKIDADIGKALEKVATKYNIDIRCAGGSFSSGNFKLKLEGSLKSSDGTVISKAEVEFMKYHELFGFSKSDFGRKFKQGREDYKIVGLSMNAKKYPIIIEQLGTGKRYKLKPESIPFCKKKEIGG